MVRAEVEAVAVSTPEPAGLACLRTIAEGGWKVGIVSNNSEDAVRLFLVKHGLQASASTIVGRPHRHPELMKPKPWPLVRATQILESTARETVLIGDSLTDIQACTATGTSCSAFANKADKAAHFARTSAVVINSMGELNEAALRLRRETR